SGVGPQPPADLRQTGSLSGAGHSDAAAPCRPPLLRTAGPQRKHQPLGAARRRPRDRLRPAGTLPRADHPDAPAPRRPPPPPPTAPPSDSRTTAKTPAPRSSATVLPGPATVGSAPSTGSPAASTATRAPSTDSPGSNRATTPTTARPLRTRPTIRAEALLPPDGIDRGFAL